MLVGNYSRRVPTTIGSNILLVGRFSPNVISWHLVVNTVEDLPKDARLGLNALVTHYPEVKPSQIYSSREEGWVLNEEDSKKLYIGYT